jgi:hypothetical protein
MFLFRGARLVQDCEPFGPHFAGTGLHRFITHLFLGWWFLCAGFHWAPSEYWRFYPNPREGVATAANEAIRKFDLPIPTKIIIVALQSKSLRINW